MLGMLAGTAAWAIALWVACPFRPRLSLDTRAARSMAAYGGAASLLEVLSLVSTRADALVVGKLLGGPALGIYVIALRVPEMLIESVAWTASKVAFPALARERARARRGVAAAVILLVRFQSLYALPMAAWLVACSPAIVVLLFSSRFEAAGAVASALAVTFAISATAFPLGDMLKAIGRQRTLVVTNLCALPVLVAGIVLLAPHGIAAVAWARAGAEAVHAVLVFVIAARALETPVRSLLAPLGPGLAAAGGVAAGTVLSGLAVPGGGLAALLAVSAAGLALGVLALRVAAPELLRRGGAAAGWSAGPRPALGGGRA
jgi:PST family polysaccharide transporter